MAQCVGSRAVHSFYILWSIKLLSSWNDVSSCCSQQAVPYSREFKQKYDYFRKKLKKPVSRTSTGGCRTHLSGYSVVLLLKGSSRNQKHKAKFEFDGFLNKKLF